jgi:hypothetical protein
MDKASYVDQVKDLQRKDPDTKQAWWDYCERHLGGIKDPNRHEIPQLRKFLTMMGAAPRGSSGPGPSRGGGDRGGRMPMSAPPSFNAFGGGARQHGNTPLFIPVPMVAPSAMAPGSGAPLVDFIKAGQRHSEEWKKAWQSYCVIFGNGKYDPARVDESFLKEFIDYAGAAMNQDLLAQAEERGVSLEQAQQTNTRGSKRPAQPPAQDFARPSQRPRTGGAAGGGGGEDKAALVAQIKDLQRSSEETKQAWWTYCDEELNGMRDPNRHPSEVLQAFIDNHA